MGEPRFRSTSKVLSEAKPSHTESHGCKNSSTLKYEYQKSWNWNSDADTVSIEMDDVVTSNYRARIARGEVINNPMNKVTIVERTPKPTPYYRHFMRYYDGRYTGAKHSGIASCDGRYFDPYWEAKDFPSTTDTLNACVQQAVTKAHANASSTELAALSTAAELKETVKSTEDILKRVLRIARAARKLNLKALRNELKPKEIASRYMELRYAIRPLVCDVQSCVNAYQATKHFKHVRSTARGFAQLAPISFEESKEACDGPDVGFTMSRKYTRSADIRAGVLCSINTSFTSILGIDQPFEAIWEVIPFSFVLDWFWNIGATMASWTPQVGVSELASWVSIKELEVSVCKVSNFHAIDRGYYNIANTMTWPDAEKNRTILSQRRIVNPQLSHWPCTTVRLDGFKLLDLAIIGRQLMS